VIVSGGKQWYLDISISWLYMPF